MTYIHLGIKLSTHIPYLSKYKMFMLKKYKNKKFNTLLLLSLLSNINFYIINNYYFFFLFKTPCYRRSSHFLIFTHHITFIYFIYNIHQTICMVETVVYVSFDITLYYFMLISNYYLRMSTCIAFILWWNHSTWKNMW